MRIIINMEIEGIIVHKRRMSIYATDKNDAYYASYYAITVPREPILAESWLFSVFQNFTQHNMEHFTGISFEYYNEFPSQMISRRWKRMSCMFLIMSFDHGTKAENGAYRIITILLKTSFTPDPWTDT